MKDPPTCRSGCSCTHQDKTQGQNGSILGGLSTSWATRSAASTLKSLHSGIRKRREKSFKIVGSKETIQRIPWDSHDFNLPRRLVKQERALEKWTLKLQEKSREAGETLCKTSEEAVEKRIEAKIYGLSHESAHSLFALARSAEEGRHIDWDERGLYISCGIYRKSGNRVTVDDHFA
jgi:hypothetical protein